MDPEARSTVNAKTISGRDDTLTSLDLSPADALAPGLRLAAGMDMNVKVLIPTLLIGFTMSAHAGERVSIRVSPAVAFAPANLFVRTTIDANSENRSVEIIAESGEFYRSSEITLDGDRAPRVTLMQFKSVPGGMYQVRAVLRGAAGREIASTETKVNIVGDQDY
jgi:hypothetical protein